MQINAANEAASLVDVHSADRFLVDALLLWARLWSPFLDREQFAEFAKQQDLNADVQTGYDAIFNLFHVGFPAPAISALMHVSLNQDGGRVREDIVRILSFMDLQWTEHRLPPDHIAVLCDILAALLHEQQLPLANLLLERYMSPWLEVATSQLSQAGECPAAEAFFSSFASDIASCQLLLTQASAC